MGPIIARTPRPRGNERAAAVENRYRSPDLEVRAVLERVDLGEE